MGREKLLLTARERVGGGTGRSSLLQPSVRVEPLLLPGAMALLHQVRRVAGRRPAGRRPPPARCPPHA